MGHINPVEVNHVRHNNQKGGSSFISAQGMGQKYLVAGKRVSMRLWVLVCCSTELENEIESDRDQNNEDGEDQRLINRLSNLSVFQSLERALFHGRLLKVFG